MRPIQQLLIYYIAAVSFVTFLLWGVDKFKAVRRQWRIPERWLYLLVIFGGAFGALAGMLTFRHKTRKISFWITVIISCMVHTLLVIIYP